MQKYLISEVLTLKNNPFVDQKTLQNFINRINNDSKLVKTANIQDHFCAFFLPVNLQSKTIYLGHHKKAQDWIPPGGHIEKGETTLQTVKREFTEELEHKLTNEKIVLYNLSIKQIIDPKLSCKTHYDFWYLVFTEKINFSFDKGEFYACSWLTLNQAKPLTKIKTYNSIIQNLQHFLV